MILGLDLGITTGWSIIDESSFEGDRPIFRGWGEIRAIWGDGFDFSRPAMMTIGARFLPTSQEYSFVIAEAPVIVGVSILGRQLQAVIEHFRREFPSMITIGSGVWKTSNVKQIDLPEKGSPHQRDSFYVAHWGYQKYATTNDRSSAERTSGDRRLPSKIPMGLDVRD